ncbi:isopentenyl-diphosphate delta-isomerase [Phakopsora pachyrhizi]|uniref:isopentenyl-diphosphate Delta-isomerase n=1 Tax=Phakopsora pachyrhizi TaxID=170000 RepID=A0AAV0B0B8_PHAPC|nr:isopentenyl-diphosphate delta-isomerase [Phakopsora pachyrhizi]
MIEPVRSLELEGHNEEQVALMEERLILLDRDDNPIGKESKKTCHLMVNIQPPLSLLHRAFSVFLFRPSDGKLLLQKRASEKITFPSLWTNTCCSHPLAIESEMETSEEIGERLCFASNLNASSLDSGVRRAAQRKLNHELGIKAKQVPLSNFTYLTRIHYLAPSDGIWGEHEIDYILFITADVDLNVNLNECSDVTWVSPSELRAMIADPSNSFTPWFELIVNKFLFSWWEELLKQSEGKSVDTKLLTNFQDGKIHRM